MRLRDLPYRFAQKRFHFIFFQESAPILIKSIENSGHYSFDLADCFWHSPSSFYQNIENRNNLLLIVIQIQKIKSQIIYISQITNSQMKVSSQNSNASPQMRKKGSTQLLKSCEKVIEDLQQQLSRYIQINQQQQQLINMLTKERDFYSQEAKSNVYQEEYIKIKEENQKNTILISALKKHNKQLTEKIYILEEKNAENEQFKHNQQLQINQINKEKKLLENQWNRVITAVKAKLKTIANDRKDNKENRKMHNKIVEKSREKNHNKDGKKGKTLQQKAAIIIEQINQKLAVDSFQDLVVRSNLNTQEQKYLKSISHQGMSLFQQLMQ